MKYKNFDDFFSSIDINKNEMIDNWENLKKRKKNSFALTSNAFYLSELQPVLMLFQPEFHYHFSEIEYLNLPF